MAFFFSGGRQGCIFYSGWFWGGPTNYWVGFLGKPCLPFTLVLAGIWEAKGDTFHCGGGACHYVCLKVLRDGCPWLLTMVGTESIGLVINPRTEDSNPHFPIQTTNEGLLDLGVFFLGTPPSLP